MAEIGERLSKASLNGAARGSAAPPRAQEIATYVGEVLHGSKLGRTIGFPTANISLSGARPIPGIYAACVRLEDGRARPGVAYFGSRPTVDGQGELLEVFLFDFDEEIYGTLLRVQLLGFIRGDVKFASLDLMVAQMNKDRAEAIRILEDWAN